MNEKILITGADGFIGSHLTECLIRKGHEVRAFTLYNSFGSLGWLDKCENDVRGQFEVFSGDIRDPNGVKVAMSGCTRVLHLAALIGIPYSYHSPDSYVDTNIKGTLNILQAARDLNVDMVVHTSTSEVYGTAQFVPISEHHPLQGQSPYAATKIGADQLALSFNRSFDLPVVVIRPFNTYGPRQSARAVIPTIISQIASGNAKLQLGSLTPTRDFSYVDDTVDGFIKAMVSHNAIGEVINLGSNFEISIGECFALIKELMGIDVIANLEGTRMRPINSEVERLFACNQKAKALLGWQPNYGGIEGFKKGLEKTIAWFSNKNNLQHYKTNTYNI
jgi:NAD dependent epimerase/dehydratase